MTSEISTDELKECATKLDVRRVRIQPTREGWKILCSHISKWSGMLLDSWLVQVNNQPFVFRRVEHAIEKLRACGVFEATIEFNEIPD
jgi:hypothetical protein